MVVLLRAISSAFCCEAFTFKLSFLHPTSFHDDFFFFTLLQQGIMTRNVHPVSVKTLDFDLLKFAVENTFNNLL